MEGARTVALRKDRKQRKAETARKERLRTAKRRARLTDLLSGLGYDLAEQEIVELLDKRRYRVPSVALSPEAAKRSASTDLRAALLNALETSSVELAPLGVRTPLVTFFADYLAVADACRAEVSAGGNAGPAWAAFAATITPHYEANLNRGLIALSRDTEGVLLPLCSFDEEIYFARYSYANGRMEVLVDVHPAKPTTFERDGDRRPAWQCGMPFGPRGIEWVTWPAACSGKDDKLPSANVYLQSHALQRLRERVCIESEGLTDWVWQSLRKPAFVEYRGRRLAKFRIAQWHLGYFTFEEVDGKILITTFLFLTNAGTPEGDKLRERTRFATDQITWLQMDRLSYFLMSDVPDDPRLREFFAECGCGHLFEMLRSRDGLVTLRLARDTRRHLEMVLAAK